MNRQQAFKLNGMRCRKEGENGTQTHLRRACSMKAPGARGRYGFVFFQTRLSARPPQSNDDNHHLHPGSPAP